MRPHLDQQGPASTLDKSPLVLLVEDDSVARNILHLWLRSWGFEVLTACNGEEAWSLLEVEPAPKLVIADWVMPGMDGLELCRRIRQRPRGYYQYFLMVTGRSEMGHVVHALQSGADDCISKPFESPELRARITVACRLLALQDELIQAREEIRQQAMRDSLTGLWTRNAFTELFEFELDRARRIDASVGLLLLDLDHFKQVNDAYGHLVGDIVLRKAAKLLRQHVRASDFVGRYGGEEFLIAIPNCNREQLSQQAERLRSLAAAKPLRIGGKEIAISFSVGTSLSSAHTPSLHEVFAIADLALYHAKNAGRNLVAFCNRHPADVLNSSQAAHFCTECESASRCISPRAAPDASMVTAQA